MADDLTVIVVAVVGGEALEQCAGAVRAQASNLLLVTRDGTITDGEGKQLGFAEQCNIPFKRKTAVELSSTPLVGLIEDTVIPGPDWVSALKTALADPATVACGGPITVESGLPASSSALALSEYGAFNSRNPRGETSALPGCNFAFRRDALLEAMAGGDGLVDQVVFDRLRRQAGKLVWAPDMGVTFCHANGDGARLATRFRHGRIYASASGGQGLLRRAASAGKALLLPPVLTMRSLRNRPVGRLSASTLGWLMLQSTAWAAGEFAGAVFGSSAEGMRHWQ